MDFHNILGKGLDTLELFGKDLIRPYTIFLAELSISTFKFDLN